MSSHDKSVRSVACVLYWVRSVNPDFDLLSAGCPKAVLAAFGVDEVQFAKHLGAAIGVFRALDDSAALAHFRQVRKLHAGAFSLYPFVDVVHCLGGRGLAEYRSKIIRPAVYSYCGRVPCRSACQVEESGGILYTKLARALGDIEKTSDGAVGRVYKFYDVLLKLRTVGSKTGLDGVPYNERYEESPVLDYSCLRNGKDAEHLAKFFFHVYGPNHLTRETRKELLLLPYTRRLRNTEYSTTPGNAIIQIADMLMDDRGENARIVVEAYKPPYIGSAPRVLQDKTDLVAKKYRDGDDPDAKRLRPS